MMRIRLIVLLIACSALLHFSSPNMGLDWWQIGRQDLDWSIICQDWPSSDLPQDFPPITGYNYAGRSVHGTLLVKPDKVIQVTLEEQLPEPFLVRPYDRLETTELHFGPAESTNQISQGPVLVWMAASAQKGVSVIVLLSNGDFIESWISSAVFAAPCDRSYN